jgi:hypothetical protein
MLGCISPDIGDKNRWYCHWHYVSLSRPKWSQDFEEFSKWNKVWEGYCSTENHYVDAVLWDSITGIRPLHGEPHWCGLLRCRHFGIDETGQWLDEGKGLPPKEQPEWTKPGRFDRLTKAQPNSRNIEAEKRAIEGIGADDVPF